LTNVRRSSNARSRSRSRSRRGVGAIIGGAILAAILFTSVYLYFFTIMEGQTVKGKADAKLEQLETNKKLERFVVTTFTNSTTENINAQIKNTGTVPTKLSYVVVYDDKSIPVYTSPDDFSVVLNSGQNLTVDTGILSTDQTKKFRTDVISERGNIVTATSPAAPDINQKDITNIINQLSGFGSLQLDFKSLGVIYTHETRGPINAPIMKDGVDQSGWDVKFGNGTGYPAFRLPGTTNVVNRPEAMVLRVRNVDPSGQDMTLYANTAIGLSLAGKNLQQTPGLFLCYANQDLNTVQTYSEKTSRKVVLPNAYGDNGAGDSGWVYLYFCDAEPGTTDNHSAITDWEAKKFIGDLNPVFLVARGEFENIYTQYGQTIPYQAVTITDDFFISCLKSTGSITSPSDSCSSPTTDKYHGTVGDTAWVYISGPIGSPPYSTRAIWINPDGQAQNLLSSPYATKNPFPIVIPSQEPDGTPIKPGLHIIQIVDKNDNIYSMTFRVD